MNRFLIFFLILLAFEVLLATLLKYRQGVDRPANDSDDPEENEAECQERLPWYLAETCITRDFKQVSQDVLSFLVLFNYIIPISLYVTLEMQKFIGSLFFSWDIELYDEENNQPAKCNSSDLNEELGQVSEYLLLSHCLDLFTSLFQSSFIEEIFLIYVRVLQVKISNNFLWKSRQSIYSNGKDVNRVNIF